MVTISAREWDGNEARPHHLMRLCARSGWQVLFVEPPATLIAPFRTISVLRRWRNWLEGVRAAGTGIRLLAPPPILPLGSKRRWINRINQWLIARSVAKALRELEASAVDIYTFLPTSIDLLAHLRHERLIYDCVDDHAAFTGLIDPDEVRRMERELMGRADVCFASAQALFDRKRGWSANLHLVPNGCEYEHFEPAGRAGALPTPPELSDLVGAARGRRAPSIVGFIGGLGDWIDLELIETAARQRPDWHFVLVGPALTSVEPLTTIANVHLLGPRPYRDLPCFVQHFDVCLIPFRLNELTRSVNPIKLFEYLAAGKPVVSTPLPEVVPYRDVVEIACDADGFVAAIERSMSSSADTCEAARARRAIAACSSWTSRWERIVASIRCSESQR